MQIIRARADKEEVRQIHDHEQSLIKTWLLQNAEDQMDQPLLEWAFDWISSKERDSK